MRNGNSSRSFARRPRPWRWRWSRGCCSPRRTLFRMHAPVYAAVGRRFGRSPNLLHEMREYVRRQALLQRAYARAPHAAQRQRKSTTRTLRFLDAKYGADGNSKRRLDWKNPASGTIGSTAAWPTQALASASTFVSLAPALTRFTWLPQIVGSPG